MGIAGEEGAGEAIGAAVETLVGQDMTVGHDGGPLGMGDDLLLEAGGHRLFDGGSGERGEGVGGVTRSDERTGAGLDASAGLELGCHSIRIVLTLPVRGSGEISATRLTENVVRPARSVASRRLNSRPMAVSRSSGAT